MKSLKNYFWVKTFVALSISFENCRKHKEENPLSVHTWCVNHVDLQLLQVSNYNFL